MADETKIGRPPQYDEKMTPYVVNLPPHLEALAIKLGDGNRSEGIRRALERANGEKR